MAHFGHAFINPDHAALAATPVAERLHRVPISQHRGCALPAMGMGTRRIGPVIRGLWSVVELGHFTTDFTTDFAYHDRGEEAEGAASSASGAHKVRDRIASPFTQHNYPSDFETIGRALKSRKIMGTARKWTLMIRSHP